MDLAGDLRINVPVALIALALIAIAKPATEHRPAPMDYRGLALIVAGVGLSVFGLQQSSIWGWGNPAIEVCIVAGVIVLGVFVAVERRTASPLIDVHIFGNRAFALENVILGIAMMAFIPVFFFASVYGQIALAEKAMTASLLICTSSSATRASRRSAAGCWTGPGPSGQWCSAAPWRPWDSRCGAGRRPTCTSVAR